MPTQESVFQVVAKAVEGDLPYTYYENVRAVLRSPNGPTAFALSVRQALRQIPEVRLPPVPYADGVMDDLVHAAMLVPEERHMGLAEAIETEGGPFALAAIVMDEIDRADAEPIEGARAVRELAKLEAHSARLNADARALEGVLRVAEARGIRPGQTLGEVVPELAQARARHMN